MGILVMFDSWNSYVLAEPCSPSSEDTIAHLQRAQETVQTKQVEVTKAERGKRVQFQQAEVCKPGGIVTAGRFTDCVSYSREVPIVIQEVAVAKKADLQPALEAFDEAMDTLNRRCMEGP